MKNLKYINITNYLLSGIIIIILGILIIIGNQILYSRVIKIVAIIFLLRSLSELEGVIIRRKKFSKEKIISIVVNITFAIVLILFEKVSLSILPILFSLYLLLNSFIKIINFTLLMDSNKYKKYIELFFSIFFLISGVIIAVSPLIYLNNILIFIGIYCILLGLDSIKNFILELIPISKKLKSIRISLPVILEAFTPIQMLNYINTYFNEEQECENILKSNDNYDLEILIHTSNKGSNALGHMDFYFDNKIISYGNYDPSSRKMLSLIGDGVLFEANKEKYIRFCIEHSSKTLIGFGIKLSEKEINNIRNEYKKIKDSTYIWDLNSIKNKKYSKCYSKLLKRNIGAKFYKFKSGEFKKYFVCGANCTKFAEKILGGSTGVLKMVGVITPGTYLEYLEHEYKRKNSNVVYKNIYNEKTKNI